MEQEGMSFLEKRAENGNSDAMCRLGYYYMNGYAVLPHEKKCLYWFEKAAEHGETDAFLNLGRIYSYSYFGTQDYNKAVYFFKKGVVAGSHYAMLELARFYEKGIVVKEDKDKATQLYREAYDFCVRQAKEGNAFAQMTMGEIYYNGGIPLIGIPQSDVKAAQWYEKSAIQNDSYSQVQMGLFYCHGIGVEQNYLKAIEWYEKAANNNNRNGICALGSIYILGLGVEQDAEKSVEYYRRAAELGSSFAQMQLGIFYQDGIGVEKDDFMAAELLQKACDNKVKDAYAMLGDCYMEGRGVEMNERKAKELYRQGAKLGDLGASIKLAESYLCMMGTSNYHFREAKDILVKVCKEEENYRENRTPFVQYRDDFGRSYIENPLDPKYLKLYGKAYFMLAALKDNVRGKRTNEVIRLYRMAEQLGYIDEEYPDDTPSARLAEIIRNTKHKFIQDTIESYVEIRDVSIGKKKRERYDVFIHHTDGSETLIDFHGRNKFIYILCTMAAYEKQRGVFGIRPSLFTNRELRKKLIALADYMNVVDVQHDRWIDEFAYQIKKINKDGDYEKGEKSQHNYYQAISNLNKAVETASDNDEERALFSVKRFRLKDSNQRIAYLLLNPSQIKIPDSLNEFLTMLPTKDDMGLSEMVQE